MASVPFGFQDVPADEKATLVGRVFESVASRYDLMNDLMSLGVHRLWKNTLVGSFRAESAGTLLDVGGGTGDIAFRFLARGGRNAVVVDINEEMIRIGRGRAADRGIPAGIEWVRGDAEQLPLADGSGDTYTTAFCLRNVTRPERALREAFRALKPGGRFLCLEFSRVALPVLDRLYDLYSDRVIPALGQLVARDHDAYQYLVESIRRFPSQEIFARMIADAGFAQVTYRNLSGGIAAIHSGWRI
ncbi:MAG: class I SAM-dependent methyltransferase [Rhodospirillales bacterium]|nr:class I SAM-dependent methyltransferase [Rhodospirillales bacterium]